MSIVLFDGKNRNNFLPLVATRAMASLRTGLLTTQKRWELATNQQVYVSTQPYLQPLYQAIPLEPQIWLDASIVFCDELLDALANLNEQQMLVDEFGLVALKTTLPPGDFDVSKDLEFFVNYERISIATRRFQYPHQLIQWNEQFFKADFELLTFQRKSHTISFSNQVLGPENIFLEEGVTMELCTLNATAGPIYIEKGSTIMEGCLIRGPFGLGANSLLKMGSKIYGASSFGPNCVGGGEIKNVIMQGFSNKAHDGYLGDSYIGEWCNFGAGTSNSNVKNTGGDVLLWNEGLASFVNAGLKCGLFMGDYSRVAINSSINTGSYIGVCCNVFGSGLLPKVVNDFSWGFTERYDFQKALVDVANWKKMKHRNVSQEETEVLHILFSQANKL